MIPQHTKEALDRWVEICWHTHEAMQTWAEMKRAEQEEAAEA